MALYRVTWEIDVDASSAKKAAEDALKIQRDPESTATVFMVGKRKSPFVGVKGLVYKRIELSKYKGVTL